MEDNNELYDNLGETVSQEQQSLVPSEIPADNTNADSGKKEQTFHYDAFISYRHVEPDQSVAKMVHEQLEAYKLPHNVKATLPNGNKRIARVFRDEEELPLATNLADSIVNALRNSEYLIVICSPALIESPWCALEMKTFIEMHGHDRVLTVLADGEPPEIIPEILCQRTRSVTGIDGTVTEVMEHIEPLAADLRAPDQKTRKNLAKTQLLKLLAAMYSVNYDTLRRRQREKRIRRVIGGLAIAASLLLAFGIYSTAMMITLHSQKVKIEAQNEQLDKSMQLQLQRLSESFVSESESRLEQCNRLTAIEAAYNSLGIYEDEEGNKTQMPGAEGAELALSNALNVYGVPGSWYPEEVIECSSTITKACLSPDGRYLMLKMDGGRITIRDFEEEHEDWSILTDDASADGLCDFLDSDRIIYMDAIGSKINVLNLKTDEEHVLCDCVSTARSVWLSDDRDYIAFLYCKTLGGVDDASHLVFYKTDTLELVKSVDLPCMTYSFQADFCGSKFIFAYDTSLASNKQKISIVDFMNGSEEVLMELEEDYSVTALELSEDAAYINVVKFSSQTFMLEDNKLMKVSLSSKEILWEDSKSIFYDVDMIFTVVDDGTEVFNVLIVKEDNVVDVIDADDGRSMYQESFEGGICAYKFIDDIMYIFLNRGGTATFMLESDWILPNNNFNTYEITLSGDSAHSEDWSTIISYSVDSSYCYVFKQFMPEEYIAIDSAELPDYYSLECDNYCSYSSTFNTGNESKADDILGELGFDNPFESGIKTAIWSDDENMVLLYYYNNNLAIYVKSSSDYELKSEEIFQGIDFDMYFGQDANDNYYFGYRGSFAYQISPEGEITADMGGFLELSDDGEHYICYFVSGTYLECPIYTTEDLMHLAEDIVN